MKLIKTFIAYFILCLLGTKDLYELEDFKESVDIEDWEKEAYH